ncbi:MAG: 23S rRNA (pseudouridine(1915)-N(3))-methyltransferase RlmH [Alphaproteobacteria bacterium]|nr:23S rRNA (pseudouridine(1915)-N(3))-methyltransferase RlmH [Alphaproteobacteria bacterium]MDP6567728.1 23S rRNA (pseudouridine(1915)-N(3))-methyltransferase RlmH [Alphaproteobacteria bacterium]MDP6812730.1 23S rRNA (pseudouridine(1915)-N(3))-methyltransferase RlmH [Alphaproteobacteria bacterium]
MRITICAVGRARGDPSAEICQSYLDRLPWPAEVREVEVRRKLPTAKAKEQEAEMLLAAVPAGGRLWALDGRGKALSSQEFAELLGRWRDDGVRDAAFAIGGAEGLHPSLLSAAHGSLSLGAMTWPHLLARAMLAEQLYRAASILAGHPYHRA